MLSGHAVDIKPLHRYAFEIQEAQEWDQLLKEQRDRDRENERQRGGKKRKLQKEPCMRVWNASTFAAQAVMGAVRYR